MKSIPSVVYALGCGLLMGLVASACWIPELPDNTVFTCATDTDCARMTDRCMTREGQSGYCCTPSAEVCNGLDDNCNGVKDDLAEVTCYSGPEGTQGKGACKAGVPTCGADNQVRCVEEVQPQAETCNGIDDNCDGVTDEGFDLQQDNNNCGACGKVCAANQPCTAGKCTGRVQQV